MPTGAETFKEGLRMCAEVYQKLKQQLKVRGLSTGVGDEGGFAPNLANAKDIFLILNESVEQSGYRLGKTSVMQWMQQRVNCMTRSENSIIFLENLRRCKKKSIGQQMR